MSDSYPTIDMAALARHAGLSKSTVSRALRNSPEIGEATRARVHALARDLGYRPNPLGSGLAHFRQTSHVKPVKAALAWLNWGSEPSRLSTSPLLKGYWDGALAAAARLGYHLEEIVVEHPTSLSRVGRILEARGIRGILIPPHGGQHERDWQGIEWGKFSVVRFGLTVPLEFHAVMSDGVRNALLAHGAIRARGYRRVGCILHPQKHHYTHDAGLVGLDPAFGPDYRILPFVLPADPAEAQKDFETWLAAARPEVILHERPEVLPMLERAGYGIPRDIACVGLCVPDCFDGAGINQNPEDMGQAAALLLAAMVNNNERGLPRLAQRIHIPGRWVEGTGIF